MNPAQNLRHRRDFGSIRHKRPVDHNDRQLQGAGGIKFRARTGSTRVFGDNLADPLALKECQIAFKGKRATGDDGLGIGQGQRARWVDKAQNVMMLGLYGELFKLQATDGEKDSGRRIGQSVNRRRHIGHATPEVVGGRNPWCTLQRQQRQTGDFGGLNGMAAHLSRKRVGRVDNMADGLGVQIAHQALDPAKAADPLGQGLDAGRFGAPCVRENARNPLIVQGYRQVGGFGRTSQNKDAGHG